MSELEIKAQAAVESFNRVLKLEYAQPHYDTLLVAMGNLAIVMEVQKEMPAVMMAYEAALKRRLP